MAKNNVTFIMHRNWLESIKDLTIEEQDKAIAEIVRYGVEIPLQHTDDKNTQVIVNLVKQSIDKSKQSYQTKVEMSQFAGRKKKVDDAVIYKMAREGMSSKEIAEVLGCSKSAIDHSEGWKNRKKIIKEDVPEETIFEF